MKDDALIILFYSIPLPGAIRNDLNLYGKIVCVVRGLSLERSYASKRSGSGFVSRRMVVDRIDHLEEAVVVGFFEDFALSSSSFLSSSLLLARVDLKLSARLAKVPLRSPLFFLCSSSS